MACDTHGKADTLCQLWNSRHWEMGFIFQSSLELGREGKICCSKAAFFPPDRDEIWYLKRKAWAEHSGRANAWRGRFEMPSIKQVPYSVAPEAREQSGVPPFSWKWQHGPYHEYQTSGVETTCRDSKWSQDIEKQMWAAGWISDSAWLRRADKRMSFTNSSPICCTDSPHHSWV